MTEAFALFATFVFIVVIIVFGYRREYRENPVLFFKTLLAVPLQVLLHFTGLKCILARIQQLFFRKKS